MVLIILFSLLFIKARINDRGREIIRVIKNTFNVVMLPSNNEGSILIKRLIYYSENHLE